LGHVGARSLQNPVIQDSLQSTCQNDIIRTVSYLARSVIQSSDLELDAPSLRVFTDCKRLLGRGCMRREQRISFVSIFRDFLSTIFEYGFIRCLSTVHKVYRAFFCHGFRNRNLCVDTETAYCDVMRWLRVMFRSFARETHNATAGILAVDLE